MALDILSGLGRLLAELLLLLLHLLAQDAAVLLRLQAVTHASEKVRRERTKKRRNKENKKQVNTN